MDWTTFFLCAAGAAATLMGLLFVGVQFHIDRLMTDVRWQATARSTFFMYVFLFILPFVLLMPTLDNSERSIVLFCMAAFGVLRAERSWRPVWRSQQQRRTERLWQTAWLLVGPLAIYLSVAELALELNSATQTDGIYTGLAWTMVGFFLVVLRNSWNLLFEIEAEKHRSKGGGGRTRVSRSRFTGRREWADGDSARAPTQ